MTIREWWIWFWLDMCIETNAAEKNAPSYSQICGAICRGEMPVWRYGAMTRRNLQAALLSSCAMCIAPKAIGAKWSSRAWQHNFFFRRPGCSRVPQGEGGYPCRAGVVATGLFWFCRFLGFFYTGLLVVTALYRGLVRGCRWLDTIIFLTRKHQ